MPVQRPQLANDEIYHIVIRGVGDSKIFKDDNDYYRAIFSIYEFNNTKPVEIRIRRQERRKERKNGEQFSDSRDLLVEILCFCFMPNHIHLLLRQIKKDGITRFMRKLGAGYGGYFNRKYGRKGHLFQGRFRAVHIKSDDHLQIVFTYIHTNPTSLIEPKWKEKGIKDSKKLIKFLEDYKWSSYLDYIDKKNFPSVTERDFFLEILGGIKGCREAVKSWIRYKGDIKGLENVELE